MGAGRRWRRLAQRWAAVALLSPAAACVHARGPAAEPSVVEFRIEGLKQLDAGALKERLATRESREQLAVPLVGPVVNKMAGKEDRLVPLDPAQLAVDRARVEAWCRERGYYGARVLEPEVVEVAEGQVEVTLRVEEGEPVRVARLDLEGLDAAPEARDALPRPALRLGDVFAVARYDELRDQVARALLNHGWAAAEVQAEAQVLPDEHAALVRYAVRPGPRYRFGAITVQGTRDEWAARVRDVIADEVEVGSPYDERKLVRAQGRAMGLGVFAFVKVERGPPDPEAQVVPLTVTVRDASQHRVQLGPNLEVNSGDRVTVSGTVGWTDRNFLGEMRRLDLSLTAGYAWVLVAPQNEGPVGKIVADFSDRAIWGQHVDLGTHLEVQRALQQGYDYWAQIGRVLFPARLSQRLKLIPSYNVEVYELSDTVQTLDPNDPNSKNELLQSCPQRICLLTYLQQRIEYDRRDDPVQPRHGYYLGLSVQEGWRMLGYGYQFVQVLPEARAYFPVGDRSALAARVRLGAFMPIGEADVPPTVALFESGGSGMRGYGLDRLSPMLCVTGQDPATGQTVCTDEWVPEGGNGLVEASLELRFPIRGPIWGAVFADAGYVSRRSAEPTAYQDVLHLRNLQLAAGVGLRFQTPFGPVRFDVAVRLPSDLSPGVEFYDRFPATPPSSQVPDPGPHREPILQGHLSIGEAF